MASTTPAKAKTSKATTAKKAATVRATKPAKKASTARVTATIRYIHMAPQKVRRIASLVRRLPVVQAEQLLVNIPKRAGRPVLKAIHSAAANAEHNSSLDRKKLIVDSIQVGESMSLPRFMPRAQGRAYKIRKRFSHIDVVLVEGN